jgi:hypothetical protein
MNKVLTATLAVAIAVAPASAHAQGRITGQQSYVTGSKPHAEPDKYKVVKVVKVKKANAAKTVHHKRSHKVAKAPRYAKHSFHRSSHHQQQWRGHHHWLLPALVGAAIGLGLFRFWH